MPKYKARVTVTATVTYTVELEAQNDREAEAESHSCHHLADCLPEDFQVAEGYCEYDTELDQLTAICPDCDTEHPIPLWNDNPLTTAVAWWPGDPDYCAACGAKQETARALRGA